MFTLSSTTVTTNWHRKYIGNIVNSYGLDITCSPHTSKIVTAHWNGFRQSLAKACKVPLWTPSIGIFSINHTAVWSFSWFIPGEIYSLWRPRKIITLMNKRLWGICMRKKLIEDQFVKATFINFIQETKKSFKIALCRIVFWLLV